MIFALLIASQLFGIAFWIVTAIGGLIGSQPPSRGLLTASATLLALSMIVNLFVILS
jgi:hypothetical protein